MTEQRCRDVLNEASALVKDLERAKKALDFVSEDVTESGEWVKNWLCSAGDHLSKIKQRYEAVAAILEE